MYSLGVDLGGTNIAIGLVSETGELLYKESMPTRRERPAEVILKDLANLCIKILETNFVQLSEVRAIGVGSPGACDSENGVIVYANNLHFENTPVRKIIQQYIDLPVFVENDANCAALGENTSGATKGSRMSVTITLGTGVGSGLIVDGKIFTGAFFGGTELGHHVIHEGGERCTCGRYGCWEAYASATALIRDAKMAMIRYPETLLNEMVNHNFEFVQARTVFDAATGGDRVAQELINKYLHYVAEGLANVINIFQPEIIAIGGGICAQGDAILNPLKAYTEPLVYGSGCKTNIVIASLKNDAGIIGAAMLS